MQIICQSCGNPKGFTIPLWVRVTFKINPDGLPVILHTRELESIEEKLTDQGKSRFELTCRECGGEAKVVFNEYERIKTISRENRAWEQL